MLLKSGFCQNWSVITSKHLLYIGLFGQGVDAALSNMSAERGGLASLNWNVDVQFQPSELVQRMRIDDTHIW